MENNEDLDELLEALAKNYEDARPNQAVLLSQEALTKQSVRELIASLKAEGSITERMGGVRFTAQGYNKYRDRVAALRRLAP